MPEPVRLSDYFKTGQPFVYEIPDLTNPDETLSFELWLQKPNPLQQEEATKVARAKQARIKQRYRDEDSIEYLSLQEEIEQLGGVDELIDTLGQVEEAKLRQQAYQEILYADEEMQEELGTSDWGPEGSIYFDLLGALRDRYVEVTAANEALEEEDKHLAVNLLEDEEYQRLQAWEESFQEETTARAEHLVEQEKVKLRGNSTESLRKMMFKKMVETEAGLAWLQEYRMRMLFFACRKIDSHNSFYFKDMDELWNLPDHVRAALSDGFNELDQGLDDIKNSLSLLRS